MVAEQVALQLPVAEEELQISALEVLLLQTGYWLQAEVEAEGVPVVNQPLQ